MCTRPIRIKNPTKEYKDGTRPWLYVPCGTCEECRSTKSDNWYQRIMMEFAECRRHQGKVVFVTFTYNDDHVPRYYYDEELTVPLRDVDGNILKDSEGYERRKVILDRNGDPVTVQRSFPCFSKRDKDKFLNSFRKHFEDVYGLTDNTSYRLKYLWASEYGLTPGYTHRPHYHVLFFLPNEYLSAIQKDYPNLSLEQAVKSIFEHYWSDLNGFGFVGWSKNSSVFVNSDFAPRYVSKYMNKDVSFYQQPEVAHYMKGVKRSKDDVKYKAVKHLLPKTWNSLEFGAGLIDYYKDVESYINGIDFSKIIELKSQVKKGKTQMMHIPKYIKDKFYYEYDENGRKVLKPEAKEFDKLKFLSTFVKVAKKFEEFSSLEDIKYKIYPTDIADSPILKEFGTIEEIVDFLKHNLHSKQKYVELSLYNSVWSGLTSFRNPTFKNDFSFLDKCSHEDFVNASIEQYISSLYVDEESSLSYIFSDKGVFCEDDIIEELKYSETYDSLPRFANFNLIIKIIGEIQNIYHKRCHQKYLQDLEHRKLMKMIV